MSSPKRKDRRRGQSCPPLGGRWKYKMLPEFLHNVSVVAVDWRKTHGAWPSGVTMAPNPRMVLVLIAGSEREFQRLLRKALKGHYR